MNIQPKNEIHDNHDEQMSEGLTRVSDEQFFMHLIDDSIPELKAVKQAAAAQNYRQARALFAAYARKSWDAERFSQLPVPGVGRSFLLETETALSETDRYRAAADRILEGQVVSTGTAHAFEGEIDWMSNPTYNQYREWTWQLNRHHDFVALARAYRQTGDEKYAEGFANLFLSWIRQAKVPEAADPGATKAWRTIEAGLRMSRSWPYAFDAFYQSEAFTDDVLVTWYKSLWEHGWRLENFHVKGGNWLLMEMNGLAHIGILFPALKDASRWVRLAFEKMTEELTNQLYPDGFQIELTTGYHQVLLHNYKNLMNLAQVYDVPIPKPFYEHLKHAYAVNLRIMMPDGRLPNVNDGSWSTIVNEKKTAAQFYADEEGFQWAASEGREGKPPKETSYAFPYAGYYVMRSSWEKDAVWALFDGGPFGYAHQHEDKLNLIVHAYGSLLLTEGGNYAYDASEMRQYVLSTRSHNTIRVNGEDQNRRKHYRRDQLNIEEKADASWKSDETHDVVEGTYDEGYGPEAETAVKHVRKVIFVKKDEKLGPFFIVVDRLVPRDGAGHAYEILWHFESKDVETDGVNAYTVNKHSANVTVAAAANAGLQLHVIEGQKEPEWQGWTTIGDGLQGEFEPAPAAVYTLSSSRPVRIVTVIHPMKPGSERAIAKVAAGINIDDQDIQLALADGTVLAWQETEFGMWD